MVLNVYREQADVVLLPIARRVTGISPNTFTYLSFLFAVLTGFSFAFAGESDDLLLLAFFLLFFSSLFDALDGKVARLTGKASERGDLLDHVLDRYSDIFIIGGIAFSPYCPVEIGLISLITVLMLSYMGTQAQAVGGTRNYGGLLGRADRLMLLLLTILIQYILFSFSIREIQGYYLLGWLMLLFILVGNVNALQRFYDTWKGLEEEEKEKEIGEKEKEEWGIGNAGEREPERKWGGERTKGSGAVAVKPMFDPETDDEIEWKGE